MKIALIGATGRAGSSILRELSARGHDVTGDARWFPFVTWTQGVFDLMAGFGAPPGHGHDYRLDYVDAWARVAAPAGWTAADTVRIETLLHGS